MVSLREPCGADEIAVDGVDTRSAVALLGRLLDGVEVRGGSTAPGLAPGLVASELVASDRDALLAALHRCCWGDRIVTTLTCSRCERLFDLSFELSAVQRYLCGLESSWEADGRGRVVHANGVALQVPRLAQEIEAASGDPRTGAERLAESCGAYSAEALAAVAKSGATAGETTGPLATGTTSEGTGNAAKEAASGATNSAAVDAGSEAPRRAAALEAASDALQAAAPIIDLELAASCADCGHQQTAHFDLQSFLLQRLINERENLLAEVHLLASAYGWSLSEILSLARSTRRQLANAIENLNSRPSARREIWR